MYLTVILHYFHVSGGFRHLLITFVWTQITEIQRLARKKVDYHGNSKIFYLSRDKLMAIMFLSIENFTCPKEQISLFLSVLKQFTLSKTV